MEFPQRIRATALWLATTLATTGLAVVFTDAAAQAAPHFLNATSVQVGYTDSATPEQAYEAGDVSMPIGTRTDESGTVHTSRVYATFDLTQFAGKRIYSGKLRFREVEVADCTKRAIEIWETHQIHRTPSWSKAPKATAKLDEIRTAEFCPAFAITFDVDSAVAEAVRKGKEKISFEIRVPADVEAGPSYARKLYWFTGVNLTVAYNTPPTIDDRHMYQGGQPCATTAPYLNGRAGWLQGMVADADANDRPNLITEFAVWPDDDPSARRVYTSTTSFPGRVSGVTVPESDLQDGRAYSWQYRANDHADTSAWSRVCGFVFDVTRPAAPGVSSSNYPPRDTGQNTPLGEPGVFTFSGGGDPDVVGFQWGFGLLGVNTCSLGSGDVGQHECPDIFSLPRTVRTDVPGGNATVLISPDRISLNRLLVRSIDKAGSVSGQTVYEFSAPFRSEPTATTVGNVIWNRPVTVRLAAGEGITGTTRFEYRMDYNGPTQVVEPGPDGTATFTFLATNEWAHQIQFRSFSANGFVSPEALFEIFFYPWPTVTSDVYTGWDPVGGVGVPGRFTFLPPSGWLEVKGYQYSTNGGEPVYVDAGPDGTATITWAPEISGFNYIEVWGVRPDGTLSDYSGFHQFDVAG